MRDNARNAAARSEILHIFSSIALATTVLTTIGAAAHAQQAQSTTTLDTITVQGGQQTPARSSQPAAPAGPAAPAEPAPGPAPETATGPVDGYLATRTATGIKTDTPMREIPQSIAVIGQEQIRDQGAQTLQDTLRYTSGVVADGYGIDSRTDSAFIRGVEATEYLDGMRRTFNYYVYNYRIDPYFMERIEVLKGPASVLYGQASVGGIINSVSKRPQTEEYGEIGVEYGTFDFKQTKFDFTGPASEDKRWSYRLTGLVRDADTQVDYVPDDRFAIQPALSFSPSVDTNITLLAHFQRDRTGSVQQFFPHKGTIFPNKNGFIPWDTFIGEPSDHYDTDAASATLLFEHAFNDAVKLRHSSRYTDISNDYVSSYAGHFYTGLPYSNADETEMERIKFAGFTDTQIFNTDTNLEVKFNTGRLSHKVLGGFDYSDFNGDTTQGSAWNRTPFNIYNPEFGQPETLLATPCGGAALVPVTSVPLCNTEQEVSQYGFYIQDQIRLGNWIAVLGARHDQVENWATGSVTPQKDEANSYRAGLMYELPFGLTPYVSYSESFIPEVGTAFDGSTFDPRSGEMYQAGFKYTPPGTDFAINAAVYDLTESNRLVGDPNNPGFSVQAGGVNSKGWEIEGLGNLTSKLKVIANYSYTNAEYIGGLQKGFQVESVPKHLASFWAVHDFSMFGREGFSVGGGVRYIGSSWDGFDLLETPAVTLFDAMLAYENEDWRVQVTATNLEDEEYLTTCLNRGDCFLGTSRTVIAGVTRKF